MENVLSVDVENWYNRKLFINQHEKLKNISQYDQIKKSMDYTLNIFKKYKKTTTFFVLGEVAEKYPEIIEKISDDGHEIGLHGYSHIDLKNLTISQFKNDLKKSVNIIYRIIKEKPKGFRAPNFSLKKNHGWVLKTLARNNFLYDSSIFPSNVHFVHSYRAKPYIYFPSFHCPFLEDTNQSKIIEFPLLTRKILFWRLPIAGGFYLRIFGSNLLINSIKIMNKQGYPAMCYIHPWEIYGFPKIELSIFKKIFGYYNIPCNKLFEHLIKNISINPAIEILKKYEFI